MLAVLEYLRAVDKYVLHADRELMRVFEGGAISNRFRIEHDDIGEISRLQKAAMIKPEISRGQERQTPHRFFKRITFSSRTYLPSSRAKLP